MIRKYSGTVFMLLIIVNLLAFNKDIFSLQQVIATEDYSISVPKDWSCDSFGTGILKFELDQKEIGGLYVQSYYAEVSEPLKTLLPNHSEIISEKVLTGYFTEAHEIRLITTAPAASHDETEQRWLYIFLVNDQEVIYELFFNEKFVDKEQVLRIAKTLRLK